MCVWHHCPVGTSKLQLYLKSKARWLKDLDAVLLIHSSLIYCLCKYSHVNNWHYIGQTTQVGLQVSVSLSAVV